MLSWRFALLSVLTQAREITFPPSIPQIPLSNQGASTYKPDFDPIGGNVQFTGLTTFANLPYVYCLADSNNEAVEKFDIAFLGAGFDTVSLRIFRF